jgi:hypothetical protein
MLVLMMINNLFSYSILERATGNYIGNVDPRSAAMGSAAASGGNTLFDVVINPANLGFLPDGFGFQFSYDLMSDSDNRSLPMYNSFDAYVDDATYASNMNTFGKFTPGAFYKRNFDKFTIAASVLYRPFISFDSFYSEEVRNNKNSDFNGYPPILAKNYIDSQGSINAISFLTAFTYEDIASLGIELSILSGDSDLERKIIWSDQALEMLNTLTDTTNTLNREFEALQVKVGTNININQRFSVGLSFSPKIEFDVKGDKDGVDVEDAVYVYTKFDSLNNPLDSLTYADFSSPMKLRAGFCYKPRNVMRTFLNLDIEFVKWSDVNSLYENELNFYVGVEHRLKNIIPIRLGFNYQTCYSLHEHEGRTFADKVTMPAFTAGTGFTFLENFNFDISFEFSNRQYEALDLFPDSYYDHEELWEYYQHLNLEDRGWENPDTVKETFINIQSSISFKW